MRLLLIVLVLLNLLALASAQGWLGASAPRGEPERLTNQLNPERIVLGPPAEPGEAPSRPDLPEPESAPEPTAAAAEPPPEGTPLVEAAPEEPPTVEPPIAPPAASPSVAPAAPEPPACVAYAALDAEQADALVAAARSAGGDLQVERRPTSTPTAWWVRIPPAGSREAAERAVAEVRALGISDYFIVREPGPNQFSVSLGLFRTEAKAREHLAFMQNKGVTDAEVAPRNGTTYRAEFHGPASQIEALQGTASAGAVAATRSECEP